MRVSKIGLTGVSIVSALTAVTVSAASINMIHDFDEALALARESNKPVLIDFYADT